MPWRFLPLSIGLRRPLRRKLNRARPNLESLEDRVTPSTFLSLANIRDQVYDPTRNLLYLTTSIGSVERYDPAAQALLSPFAVGTSLNGADIAPDGSSLYVTDNQNGVLRRVDLDTGGVTDLSFTPGGGENGTWDIALGSNGKGLFSARYSGSGSVALREVDLASGAIVNRSTIQQNTHIQRGADRSLLFLMQSNISSGPIGTYSSATDTFPRSAEVYMSHSNSLSAVNRNGTLIAMEMQSAGGVGVMDANFNVVRTFAANFDGGVAFDPSRDLIYLADSVADQIVAFETTGWTERFRLPIGQNISASTPFGGGVMTVSNDGRFLFLSTPGGLRILDLPNNPGVVSRLEVANFPSFISRGAVGSFTVRALDDGGNVVTDYAGTVTFTSSPSAGVTLPADHTFSPADGGVKFFTAIFSTAGSYSLSARDVSSPTLTGSQSNLTIHDGVFPLIPVSGPRDLVFDATRNLLYVTTSSGLLQRYDPSTQALLTPLSVGSSLNGADITADGNTLYITENQRGPTQGIVHKVDLRTGTITNLGYNRSGLEAGSWDVAIGSGGKALVTTLFEGSGPTTLRELSLTTDTFTNRISVNQTTHLQRGGDRSLIFITQPNSSAGPITIYDALTDTFPLSDTTQAYYDNALSSVNRTGTLVATELGYLGIYWGVSIMDRGLNLVANLGPAYDGGILFDPNRDLFYAINSSTDQVVAFDTATWTEKFRVSIGENVPASTSFGNGVMAVSADGRFLFVSTSTGVRVLSLPANPGVAATLQVTGLPTITDSDVPGTFTVTARDAQGNTIADYAGTVHFSSTDLQAILPDDYTFTPADGGTRTFTATFQTVGSQTLTTRDVNVAFLTTTTGTTIHSGQPSLLPITSRRDMVVDTTRNRIYFSTSAGTIERFDLTTQTLLAPLVVGTSLNGLDITPDGRFLYVGEDVRGATQAVIRKVDLDTGAVTLLPYNAGGEAGSWDVVVLSNGKALFTTRYEGSGGVSLREIDLATDAMTVRRGVTQNTHLERSGDRSLVFGTQSNTSEGPIFTYETATDTFSANRPTALYYDNSLTRVNRNGTLLATEMQYLGLYRGFSILDRNLNAVQNLGPNFDGGLAFDPVRDLLYVADSTADQIIALDTNTWAEKFRITIGENIPLSTPYGNGVMTVSPDGRQLFLSTPSGVRVFALPQGPGLNVRLEVSSFPVFTGANVLGTFTVRALDSLGNPVPTFAETVRFTSNDPLAALPANYTFTAADGGVKTFTATFRTTGTRTLTAQTLAPLNIVPGSQTGITIHNGVVSLIPVANRKDLVYDPSRGLLYITTSSGKVERYDPLTQTLLAPLAVGTNLAGADITPDGGSLYVAETARGATQGFLRKVDLATGAISNLRYNVGGLEAGSFDVAIAANGKGFFTTNFEGSGSVQLRQFPLSDDTVSIRRGVTQLSQFNRGADRSLLFLTQSNISNGPVSVYQTASDTFTLESSVGQSLTSKASDVNRNGTLIALELFSVGIRIYAPDLSVVQTLPGLDGGLAFDPTRDVFYAVDTAADQIVAYETNTWSELFRLPVGENATESSTFGGGTIRVSDDGMFLFLSGAAGVRVYRIGDRFPLTATRLEPTPTGFTVQFNRSVNPAGLNLYDTEAGTLGAADVTLTREDGTRVRGSVALRPGGGGFTFLRTAGLLAPGTYTVTLRSATDGFRDTSEGLLDGNGDGTTGDDFTASFTIGSSLPVTVSVPNFARGPGQAVSVPANGSMGLPLRLSDGAGVTSVRLTLRYDPRLLTITSAAPSAGLSGSQASFTLTDPGLATITFSSSTPLAAGPVDFITLLAVVPDNAPYNAKHILDLLDVRINGGAIPVVADDGMHAVVYLGDATGNARLSATDAMLILRTGIGLDGGFLAHPLLDPVIAADVSGEGRVNASDATWILDEAVGMDRPQVPAIPEVIPPIVLGGPDPLLNLPANFRGRPGDTITVPVNLDVSDGLSSVDLALSYDTRRLEVLQAADVKGGTLTCDFDLFAVNLDPRTGTIRVGMGRSAGAITGRGAGSVVEITFRVKRNAPEGNAVVNLRRASGQTRTQLNEGGLELNPAPDDKAGDALDGVIRVLGRPRPAPAAVRDLPARTRFLLPPISERPEPLNPEEPVAVQCADEFFQMYDTLEKAEEVEVPPWAVDWEGGQARETEAELLIALDDLESKE